MSKELTRDDETRLQLWDFVKDIYVERLNAIRTIASLEILKELVTEYNLPLGEFSLYLSSELEVMNTI